MELSQSPANMDDPGQGYNDKKLYNKNMHFSAIFVCFTVFYSTYNACLRVSMIYMVSYGHLRHLKSERNPRQGSQT